MIVNDTRQRRQVMRGLLAIVFGLVLGGLFTKLAEIFLPQSVARTFLTTSVSTSVGPFFLDLVSVSFTVGPIAIALNVLTLVGIVLAALAVRAWI